MQAKLPRQIRFSPEVIVVDTEIQNILDKNVIERAHRVEMTLFLTFSLERNVMEPTCIELF